MTGGNKHDQEKPPMELLPTASLEEVAKVLGYGRARYGAFNWALGLEWGRLIGAAYRHLGAFQRGENYDPDTQLSHIAHLACTSLFLLEHFRRNLGVDNRHKWRDNESYEDGRSSSTVSMEQTERLEQINTEKRESQDYVYSTSRHSCGCVRRRTREGETTFSCALHKKHFVDTDS